MQLRHATSSAAVWYASIVVIVWCSNWSYSFNFETEPQDWERAEQSSDSSACHEKEHVDVVVLAGASRSATTSIMKSLEQKYIAVHWVQWIYVYFDFIYFFLRGEIRDPDMIKVIQRLPEVAQLKFPKFTQKSTSKSTSYAYAEAPTVQVAFGDCLALALWKHFLDEYPNAKVIITEREETKWLTSYRDYHAGVWLYEPWKRQPLLMVLCYVSRAFRLGHLLAAAGLIASKRGGFDLEALPQLAEVYQRSDSFLYGGTPTPSKYWGRMREEREAWIRSTVPSNQSMSLNVADNDEDSNHQNFLKMSSFLKLNGTAGTDWRLKRAFSSPAVASSATAGHNVFIENNHLHIAAASVLLLLLLAFPLAGVLLHPEQSKNSTKPASIIALQVVDWHVLQRSHVLGGNAPVCC